MAGGLFLCRSSGRPTGRWIVCSGFFGLAAGEGRLVHVLARDREACDRAEFAGQLEQVGVTFPHDLAGALTIAAPMTLKGVVGSAKAHDPARAKLLIESVESLRPFTEVPSDFEQVWAELKHGMALFALC